MQKIVGIVEIHVLNAPFPGATALLAIADHIIANYITNI